MHTSLDILQLALPLAPLPLGSLLRDSLCGRITGSGLRSCRERRPHMTMGETHLGKGFYFLKHGEEFSCEF